MDQVKTIWKQNGYPSGAKLWAILKKQGLTSGLNRKQVDALIAEQAVAQLHHRPARKKYSHITTVAPGVMYNCDLLDMTPYARDNNGNKWICICIDVFSRKASAIGMNNKTAPVAAEALRFCFDMINDKEPPKVLLSDQGSEWKGATAKMLEKMHVIHKMAEKGDHNRLGIVDRFSQTVKHWLAKHMTHEQTRKWNDVLQPHIVRLAQRITLRNVVENDGVVLTVPFCAGCLAKGQDIRRAQHVFQTTKTNPAR